MSDCVPVGWRLNLDTSQLPVEFLVAVGTFILNQDSTAEHCFQVSLLELLFILGGIVEFPVCCSITGKWIAPSQIAFTGPVQTVASQLRLLRFALRLLFKAFSVDGWRVGGINLGFLGVTIPFDGVLMGVDRSLVESSRRAIQDFSAGRLIRASRDLARPA